MASGASPTQSAGQDPGGSRALGAGLVATGRVIGNLAQLALMLVAARFLSPAQFGLFSLASAASIGLRYLAEAGWKECIMTAASDAAVRQSHGFALVTGTVLTLLGTTAGLGLAAGASDPTPYNLFAALSAGVVLGAFASAQAGVLTRRRRLVSLASVQIVVEVAALAAGIAAFFAGWGVYALAASRLVALLAGATGMAVVTQYFPLSGLWAPGLGQSLRFSIRILATRLLSFAEQNTVLFLIGALVSPAGAGLYRAGSRLAGAIGEAVGEPTRILAWTAFSPRQKGVGPSADVEVLSRQDIRAKSASFIKLLLAIYAPLYVGLALVAGPLVKVMLGSAWSPAAVVVGALAFRQLLLGPRIMSEPLFAATGRPEWAWRLAIASFAITTLIVCLAATLGLRAAAYGQIAAALIILPIVVVVQTRYGEVSWTGTLKSIGGIAVATVAMGLSVSAAALLAPGFSTPIQLALQVALGAAAYLLTLLSVDYAWVKRTIHSIVQK